MFLRRNRRTVNGECYEYWTLVKTVRTAQGPRQAIVATLGKAPGLERRTRQGWEQVGELLEGRTPAPVQGQLGQPWPAAPQPPWAQVDLRGVRVERVREFGQVYLGLALWRRLGLHTLLKQIIAPGQEQVPWELTACILTLARFCGQAKRIWVMDRGMISEENIEFLRARQARYIVGTPKRQLKQFAAQLLEKEAWAQVQAGVEVKLVPHPDGGSDEQYVLCRSSARRQKEAAMIQLARQRLRAQLDKTHASLQKRPARDAGLIERRIGRWLGRFPAAERLITVVVERNPEGHATGLSIAQKQKAKSVQVPMIPPARRATTSHKSRSVEFQWFARDFRGNPTAMRGTNRETVVACNRMQHEKCVLLRDCDLLSGLRRMQFRPLFMRSSRKFVSWLRKCRCGFVNRRSPVQSRPLAPAPKPGGGQLLGWTWKPMASEVIKLHEILTGRGSFCR